MKPLFFSVTLWLCGITLCGVGLCGVASAQEAPTLGGIWSLNRAASQIPKEIGFNVNWVPPPESGGSSSSGGTNRGRRGGGGGGGGNRGSSAPFPVARESSEDYRRVQLVTAEARNPPARLTIVDSGAAVSFTNELGQVRTLHPGGGDEWIQPEGASIRVTARRDGEKLVLVYHVETNRDVRYTLTPTRDPRQLVIDVEFLEKGTAGDIAKLVYQPGLATETSAVSAAGAPPTPGGVPAGAPASSPATGLPAEKFDQRPGAELRGLKTLGILIEDLSSQAMACGLNHDAIENALTGRLSAAGFSVRKNSDDDTYVYVNVMTTNVSGSCVSRYDAFLYTQATANLSYRDQPVLAQVSLIHRGGIATTAPPTHAPTVTRGLENYIDVFVSQIRDANK